MKDKEFKESISGFIEDYLSHFTPNESAYTFIKLLQKLILKDGSFYACESFRFGVYAEEKMKFMIDLIENLDIPQSVLDDLKKKIEDYDTLNRSEIYNYRNKYIKQLKDFKKNEKLNFNELIEENKKLKKEIKELKKAKGDK